MARRKRKLTPEEEEFERKTGAIIVKGKEGKRLERIFQRFQRDGDYINANRTELLRQYPDQFVAVFKEKVIDADKELDKLIKRLKRRYTIETRARMRIEFLHTKRPTWILLHAA